MSLCAGNEPGIIFYERVDIAMAVYAYLLIEVQGNKERSVLERIKAIPGVNVANLVTGIYDIIAVIEGDELYSLGEMVTSKIRSIDGVIKTTMAVVVPVVRGQDPFA